MNALENLQISDSRETVEREAPYNTFEVLMQQVDTGTLSFEDAISEYRRQELSDTAQVALSHSALQNS